MGGENRPRERFEDRRVSHILIVSNLSYFHNCCISRISPDLPDLPNLHYLHIILNPVLGPLSIITGTVVLDVVRILDLPFGFVKRCSNLFNILPGVKLGMYGYTHPRLLKDELSAAPHAPPLRKLWSRLHRGGQPQLLLLPRRPAPEGQDTSPEMARWRRP